jgi:hypothetical protein
MSVQLHDFSDVKQLNEEQLAKLKELEAAQAGGAAPAPGGPNAAAYRVVPNQPSARLLSGYDIPLIGLGTWCVGQRAASRRNAGGTLAYPAYRDPILAREPPRALDSAFRAYTPEATVELLYRAGDCGPRKSAKGEVGAAVATALRQGYRHIDCGATRQTAC